MLRLDTITRRNGHTPKFEKSTDDALVASDRVTRRDVLSSSSPPSWTVRPYRVGDEPGILALARLVFPEQPPDRFTTTYWSWEFLHNPAGRARMWVADDSRRIVGFYAVVPLAFEVQSSTRLGSIVVDVMTHPDYRRQGMFTRLGEAALADAGESGVEFSVGFPVRSDVMPGHLRVGWKYLFDIPVYVRPVSVAPIVRRYVRVSPLATVVSGAVALGYNIAYRPIAARWGRPESSTAGVKVRVLSSVDDRFDNLWCRSSRQCPVMVVRSKAHLNWRYVNHPYHRYQFLVAEDRGNLLGYAVVRTGGLIGFRAGIIVDLLVDPNHDACADLLIDEAVRFLCTGEPLDLLASMMGTGSPYVGALTRAGFIRTRSAFWFILHDSKGALQDTLMSDPLKWHLMWGDTDVV